MATITAQAILDKVQLLLQDTTNIRWADSELLGWLNDGQREICTVRPDACTTVGPITLSAGTKQSIPAAGTAILKVIRNSSGPAIRKVPMDLLDSTVPAWHTASASATILHYMTDPRMPRTFYVYPPATGGGTVDALYGLAPTDVAAIGNTISVDDLWANALIDYVAYRAYLKDNDLIGNEARSAAHRKLFMEFLSARSQVDAASQSADNIRG